MLLSQFGDWHSALNRSPLIIELPGESDEEYMARLECAFEDVDARVRAAGVTPDAGYRHWPEDLRSELETSWEFILDPGNYGALRQLAGHRALPVRGRRHGGGPASGLRCLAAGRLAYRSYVLDRTPAATTTLRV
ncbi:hypothetical protein [Arthrobacter sp. D1-17]